MKKLKYFSKVLSLIFIGVLVATSVSGCGKKTPAATKVITIWGFDDEDIWKPIIKDAQGEVKGYEIKYVKKTLSDSYENEALNSILSGQGPDIWAIPNDWVYRHKDKLAPMPDSLIKSSKINLDEQFVPVVKQSGYFDGKIYSLPLAIDTLVAFYNQKMLEKTLDDYSNSHRVPSNASDEIRESINNDKKRATSLLSSFPTTWNDFSEMTKLVTQRSGNNVSISGVALGTSDNIYKSQNILYALMLQNQTKMTSDNLDTANFNLPQQTYAGANDNPAKRALEFYTSFSNPNSLNYSWNSSMENNLDAFAHEKTAVIFAESSTSNYFTQKYPNFKHKAASLPQINNTNENIIDFATYTTLVVPSKSTYTTTAWNLIYPLSTTLNSYYSTVRLASPAKKKDYIPILADRQNTIISTSSFQAQTAKTWNKGRYPKDVDSIFRTAIDNVVTGKQDSQAALDLAATKVTELLRKEGW